MARTAEDYRQLLAALLPPGLIWPKDADSNLGRLLHGLAGELARVDARAGDLMDELDPRTTFELLADWEAVCGLPEACDYSGQTLAERRAALAAKYTSLGGQRPRDYIDLAAALGYPVAVDECGVFTCASRVDQAINHDDWIFTWRVLAPSTSRKYLDCQSPCNEPLSIWGNQRLECAITAASPAHTVVLYLYDAYLLCESGELVITEDGYQILVPN
jgi:uncharacterized protein YmfQ (DUF2313 family)